MSDVETSKLLRDDFPEGFVFGAGTSAFQIEGAVNEDGRGPSIWDVFAKKTGLRGWEKATDHYHKYEEDVKLMKEMGLDAYRFSISWPRVLPSGRESEGVNEEGVKFYNKLIDKLKENDIKPYATLFHWDLPQALEAQYGGFLSPQIVEDFKNYADFCFRKFGDRVKYWTTLNESWVFSYYGYGLGTMAPGRGGTESPEERKYLMDFLPSAPSRYFPPNSFAIRDMMIANEDPEEEPYTVSNELPDPTGGHPATGLLDSLKKRHRKKRNNGDPGTEPYIVSHNQILAHAAAVDLYKKVYQESQKGIIGITVVTRWFIPYSHSTSDHNAASRAVDFTLGWFMDPLTTGDYPRTMRDLVGTRLPKFTDEESKMIKGSFDFIGLNYYTTNYASHAPNHDNVKPHVVTDKMVKYLTERNGVPIGEQAGASWLHVFPQGFLELLLHIKNKYNNPCIYITENGIGEKYDASLPLWEEQSDYRRVSYHHQHLCFLKKAIKAYKINVKGYFTWSLLDNFEWGSGLSVRFGNVYVDYKDGYKRYPKLSAIWFKHQLINIEDESDDVNRSDSELKT